MPNSTPENAKRIFLTKGKVAIVDPSDYEWLSRWKWYAQFSGYGHCYALRRAWDRGKTAVERMHRAIVKAPSGMQVDHVNGDTLDNRRCNLRLCTKNQNCWNRRQSYGKSRYKGVHFHKQNKWVASIRYKRQRMSLGYFDDEETAALAYDVAAQILFGSFAHLNHV